MGAGLWNAKIEITPCLKAGADYRRKRWIISVNSGISGISSSEDLLR